MRTLVDHDVELDAPAFSRAAVDDGVGDELADQAPHDVEKSPRQRYARGPRARLACLS